jgi:uncharacterized protein (DUF2147 family)
VPKWCLGLGVLQCDCRFPTSVIVLLDQVNELGVEVNALEEFGSGRARHAAARRRISFSCSNIRLRFFSSRISAAQQARAEAETERTKASAARTEEVVAGAAVAGANRQDRADRSEAAWDTAERRQQLAESLEGKGDREAVNSWLLADKHDGTQPAAAIAQEPSLAKSSKSAKQGGKGRMLERGGLER